jgi:hypothetical protein
LEEKNMSTLFEFDLADSGITTEYAAPVYCYTMRISELGAAINMPVSTTSEALSLDANTTEWVLEAIRKIDDLRKLPANWNSYGGLKLKEDARRITYDALRWLKTQDLPIPNVALNADGTVQIEWESDGRELGVGLGSSDFFGYAKVDNEGTITEGVADAEIQEHLQKLASWLRNGY